MESISEIILRLSEEGADDKIALLKDWMIENNIESLDTVIDPKEINFLQ